MFSGKKGMVNMEVEQSNSALKVMGFIILLMSLIVVCRGSYQDLSKETTTCTEKDKVNLFASVKEVSNTCKQENTVTFETDKKEETNTSPSIKEKVVNNVNKVTTIEPVEAVLVEEKVYDGLTLSELAEKLNRSLNSTLANKGYIFANYTKETGLDPYLAVAIVLEETGCSYSCSNLVQTCNNIGGIKGDGSCNGYQGYKDLDTGIRSYLSFLYNNYYSKGLKTPENINPTYAENKDWAYKINNYIDQVKSK